jgi:hypothetical protein
MRRTLASFLLLVFSFPLIAPVVLAGAEWNLPACCRRGGKHHCDMTSMGGAPVSGVCFRSGPQLCPMYPGAQAVPAGEFVAVLNTTGAIFGLVVSHPAIDVPTETAFRVSLGRSSQKRGPPVVLS